MNDTTFPPDLKRKFVSRMLVYLALIAVLLLGAAGTIAWPAAWVYIALTAVVSFGGGVWLARHDPALLRERLRPVVQRDQKGWDRIFMLAMTPLWLGWLVLIGLDAKRYHWSDMPLALQVLGFILLCAGSYLIGLTFKANSYAAPVVKVQTARAHQVVSTGPYAYVRHPPPTPPASAIAWCRASGEPPVRRLVLAGVGVSGDIAPCLSPFRLNLRPAARCKATPEGTNMSHQ
jgi:hypothetical protein